MSDETVTADPVKAGDEAIFPDRPQRRLLRRIFNGRTVPLTAGGQEFLTYKQAVRYLTGQTEDVRNDLYEALKQQALSQKAAPPSSSKTEGAGFISQ